MTTILAGLWLAWSGGGGGVFLTETFSKSLQCY